MQSEAKTLSLIAKCGTKMYVPKCHPRLSMGLFAFLNYQNPVDLELDFLIFVFQEKTDKPIFHAEMAYHHGLRELAKETFLAHSGKILGEYNEIPDGLKNILRDLFVWNELPDELAVHILKSPSYDDLSNIVKLGYALCHKKFMDKMVPDNYKDLPLSFVDFVSCDLGPVETFLICCKNGNFGAIRYFIMLYIDIRDIRMQAIQILALNRFYGLLDYLVSLCTDLGSSLSDAVGYAVANGYHEILKFMVRYGVDISSETYNALHLAAVNGKVQMVEYLLQLDVDLEKEINKTLMTAAKFGHIPLAIFLVSIGANVKAENDLAIKVAAIGGRIKMVEYLLSIGANIRTIDEEVLKQIFADGHFAMANYLMTYDEEMNSSITAIIQKIK